jgi:DNA-binding transcriptional regulator YiaG
MSANLTVDQQLQLRELIESGQAASIRKDAKVSRPAMARTLGCAESAIWRWEHGQRMPRGRYARDYLRILTRLLARSTQ